MHKENFSLPILNKGVARGGGGGPGMPVTPSL